MRLLLLRNKTSFIIFIRNITQRKHFVENIVDFSKNMEHFMVAFQFNPLIIIGSIFTPEFVDMFIDMSLD